MTASIDARAAAARALHRVVWKHQTLDQAISPGDMSPIEQEMLYGALRHFYSLSAAVNRTLKHPVKSKDHIVWCLMIVGAYQLFHMRVPDHAAINETVAACPRLGRPWAKGLVNAVLRRMKPPERSFEHPDWMTQLIRKDYGQDADALLLANNERAPMCLRINTDRIDISDYQAALSAAEIGFRRRTKPVVQGAGMISTGPETLLLTTPVKASELPGYAEGLASIQDAGAQFAAYLLDPDPGERLLDACAAPGGKLFHLAARFPDSPITALESSHARLEQLQNEARRLHKHPGSGQSEHLDSSDRPKIELLEADARTLDWWDGEPYGAILLDAPCSGSGTLRRHPDIKILRQAADLKQYDELQRALLANLWRVLRAGGTLLYCTCSVFSKENDQVIGAFMQANPDAKNRPLVLDSGRPTRYGWQLLPTDTDTDGFYYARLQKAAA